MSRIRTNQRRIKDIVKKERHIHWRKYILASTVSTSIAAGLIFGLWSLNQALTVTQWNIHAPAKLKSNIEHVLNRMGSMDFWHSRPSLLRQQLLQQVPDLAEVNIQRQLPHALNIHVTPRLPIALWLNPKTSSLYLADNHGNAYRARNYGEELDLPVLRMEKEQLHDACKWLAQLKATQPQWFARSSEMFASYDGWKLNLSSGHQWQLPLGKRAIDELPQITKLLSQPRWHAGNWRIDTRLENRWFLRPATHEGVI